MDFKKELTKQLKKQLKKHFSLEIPPNPNFGNYALHCYKLKSDPKQIKNKLKLPKFIQKTEIKGPYLNFFINPEFQTKTTLNEILNQKHKYGSNHTGKNKKALIEHTSINPNASPHVGRARNAILGDSIAKLLKFEDYKTEIHYYVNDIGKQIAMLVLASKGKKPTFNQLLNLYINFNKKLKQNPELEKQLFQTLKSLEQGNIKTKKQFKNIVDICIKGQTKILKELGINYDIFDYESKYLWNKDTDNILKKLKATKRIFKDKDNRLILNLKGFNLPMKAPFLPLTRGDSTSLYVLRDLAYTIEKMKKAHDRNIIILGEDHKLYFQQLKSALSIINQPAPEPIHYSFILLKTGKMSTRQGKVVLLENFMKEAQEKAKKEIIKRHGKISNLNKQSKTIANSAIKLTIHKTHPEKNIIFDLKEALLFEGDTGPYIQYTHARAYSILKKAKKITSPKKFKITESEKQLINKLAEFPSIIKISIETLKTHNITTYLLQLSHLFNEFYHSSPVISEEDKDLKQTRLILVKATKQVIKNGLEILGIEAPEKM